MDFKRVFEGKLPLWEDIPDLDLYMDQVVSLVSRYLKDIGIDDEKILTDSMVNNYVKMKVIPAPKGKRYGRAHVASLLMLCICKGIVPVNTMRELAFYSDGEEKIKEEYLNFINKYSAVTLEVKKDWEIKENTLNSILRASIEQRLALGKLDEKKEKREE